MDNGMGNRKGGVINKNWTLKGLALARLLDERKAGVWKGREMIPLN